MNCFGKSGRAWRSRSRASSARPPLTTIRCGRGEEVFDRRCRNCHGGTAPGVFPIGPSLTGIVGSRAGTGASGIHSRPVMDSGIVWDRASLRRFLSNPEREIPGTLMAASVTDRAQLESLLDYLETLH